MPHGQVGSQAFGLYGQQVYHRYPAVPPSGQPLYWVQNPQYNYVVPPQPMAPYNNKPTGVVPVSTPYLPPALNVGRGRHYLATQNIDPEKRSLQSIQSAFTNKGKDDIIKGNDLEKSEELLRELERWAQSPIKERQDGVVAGGLQDGTSTKKLSEDNYCSVSYCSKDEHSNYVNLPHMDFGHIKIITGELSKMKVDVVINSTNSHLDLSKGFVSSSLLKAAGQKIQEECDTRYPKGIPEDFIAITTAGNLQCQNIYHVIVPRWDGGKGLACQGLSKLVTTCLSLAMRQGINSLAFPALGTGKLGFPADVVATAMLRSANTFLQENKLYDCQVFFVIFPSDTATKKAFDNAATLVLTSKPPSVESMKVDRDEESNYKKLNWEHSVDNDYEIFGKGKGKNDGAAVSEKNDAYESRGKEGKVKTPIAQRVCDPKETLKLEQNILKASILYPFLDSSEGRSTEKKGVTSAKHPDTVVLEDIDKHIIRFVMNSAPNKEGFCSLIKKLNGIVKWPTNPEKEHVKITRAVQFQAGEAERWSREVHEKVKKFFNVMTTREVKVVETVWDDFFEELGKINISYPDSVAVIVMRPKFSVIIAGHTKHVKDVKKKIETIAGKAEQSWKQEKVPAQILPKIPPVHGTSGVKIPSPIELSDLDTSVAKFVTMSLLHKIAFEDMMAKVHSKVYWPANFDQEKIKITCSIDVRSETAADKLKQWQGEVHQSVQKFFGAMETQEIPVVEQVWEDVMNKLLSMNIDYPDGAALIPSHKNCTIIITGHKKYVEDLKRNVENITRDAERKMNSKQAEKVSKNEVLKILQIQLLWKFKLRDEIQKCLPKLVIEIEADQRKISFTGTLKEVEEGRLLMKEKIQGIPHESFTISRAMKDLFFHKSAKLEFMKQLKEQRLTVVWDVPHHQDVCIMYSKTSEEAKHAIRIFKEVLREKNISVNDRFEELTSSTQWQHVVQSLYSKHPEEVQIDSEKNKVCITAICSVFDKVCERVEKEIQDYKNIHNVHKEFLPVPEGIFTFLEKYKHCEIDESIQPLRKILNLVFKPRNSKSKTGYEMEGTKDALKLTRIRIQTLIDNVTTDTHSVTAIGAADYFSSEGRERIKVIESETSCIIRKSNEFKEQQMATAHLTTPQKKAECDIDIGKKCIVVEGDMTLLTVDVMVNAANESMNHGGGISGAILTAGGPVVQDECDDYVKKYGIVPEGNAICSGPGNLPCRMVVHAVGPTWNGGYQGEERKLQKAVYETLKLANNENYKSIALPAISAGIFGYPLEQSVKTIVEIVKHFFDKQLTTPIKTVYLCDTDNKTVKVFIKELVAMYGPKKIKLLNDSDSETSDKGSKSSHPYHPDQVEFSLWSDNTTYIRRAKSSIDSLCDREFKSLTVSKTYCEVIKGLTDFQVEQVIKLGTRIGAYIKVNVKRGEIILEGRHEKTSMLLSEIQNILHSFAKRKDEMERARTLSSYVQWTYGDNGKWRRFDAEVNLVIETAYKRKDTQVKVKDSSGVAYVIDFQSMEEYELNQPGNKYKIHRQEVGSQTSTAGINLPKNWIPMSTKDILKQVILSPHDKEYKDIEQKFLASCGHGTVQQAGLHYWMQGYMAPQTCQRVLQIIRIQNKALYQKYSAKKQELLIRNKRDPEQWLWHGTSQDSLYKIISNGFDRSYCGKNRTSYGNGVYFDVNPSYSIGYCQSTSGTKQMFYSQVLTGEACQGYSRMRFLPERQGSSPGVHVTYDSATNNVSSPSMYIIFHDSQAYPSYLISFM